MQQHTFSSMGAEETRAPSFTPEAEQRLRELPAVYARPVPDDVELTDFLGAARELVSRIVKNDADDQRRPYRRAIASEIELAIELFEHTDEAWRAAVVALDKARLRLDPAERERAACHAPVLAMHGTRSYDEKSLYEANRWLASLDVPAALLVARVVRRENELALADDLRCRAFHSLRITLRRRST
jgi:hypothetical protein